MPGPSRLEFALEQCHVCGIDCADTLNCPDNKPIEGIRITKNGKHILKLVK